MATSTAQAESGSNGSTAKTVASGIAGAAALGFAARNVIRQRRRPKVLGMKVPRSAMPDSFDPKKVAKQLADVAERVERMSEQVRDVSARAKSAGRRFG